MTKSKIAVVGAGAIGCYFGGMLARAGHDVTLIGRAPHVDAINKNGLLFESLGRQERITVAATDRIAGVADARLVLFCVKSPDTDGAAQAMAPHLAPEAVVLSLQNGVDNVERIRAHARNPVLPVLVYAAAQMPASGFVQHTGGGSLVIGQTAEHRSDQNLPREIAAIFASVGVPVKISDDIEAELWSKLVMNCAYNAISALAEAPYGQMVAMPEVRRVMLDAIAEATRVAEAKGVRLPRDIADAALKLAEAMPVTVSSTAQDIRKGKRTEIDHLNGAVVRHGEALGIATPVNRTLNALIKLREQSTRSRDPRSGA
jgi:2-dehydropantoate 2-reductase